MTPWMPRHLFTAAMAGPSLRQLKKKTSFFFKQNIRKVQLALTDVTLPQLLTKEVTSKSRRNPDLRIMLSISKAAFEVNEYLRIIEVLHQRFARFDKKNWLKSYKALILLEHFLTHGPKSSVDEFQSDREVIKQMHSFQYIDEKGFNWGSNLKTKADRVLKLLEGGKYLQDERDRLRSLSISDAVFGSPSLGYSSTNALTESSYDLRRSNSGHEDYSRRQEAFLNAELRNKDYEETRKASRKDTKKRGNKGLVVATQEIAEVPNVPLLEEYEPLLELDNEDYTNLGAFPKYGVDWVQFK